MLKSLTTAWPALVLLAAQIPIARAVYVATVAARRHWSEVLGGGPFGTSTDLAISYGLWIPLLSTLATVAILVSHLRKRTSLPVFLFVTALCEAIALALFARSIVRPALYIMYRIGPPTP